MPDYDFKLLSHYDFELLTRDLLQKERHITLESFKSGRDGGIDLRHSVYKNNTLIVQCKHYASSGYPALLRHLRNDECPKVEKLKPSTYVLVTSVGLSPLNKKEIIDVFTPHCETACEVYGREDLNNLLGKFPDIERQNFKLWLTSQAVLDRVFHSNVYSQSEIEVELIKMKLSSYVQNQSFFEGQEILNDLHYCIITGIPGIGKTTLAEILLIHYLDHGYQPIKITSDISEGFEMLNTAKKQIFYYDDFLGQTSLIDKLNKNEDQRLLRFIQAVNNSKNAKFILTTREYILNEAKNMYEKLEQSDFDLKKCVVDLASYTKFDRAKILFNHLYFSDLPRAYREAMLTDQNYMKIVDHRNYNPRIIEGMTDYLKKLEINSRSYVTSFIDNLDNPHNLWRHAFEHQLTNASRNLLLVMASMPDIVFIEDLNAAFISFHFSQAKKHNYSTDTKDFVNSLKGLEGNFIKIEQSDENTIVQFHNASIRDFLEGYITANLDIAQELLDSVLYFEQIKFLWNLLINRGDIDSLKYPLFPFSALLLKMMESSFESDDCHLTKYVYGSIYRDDFHYRRDNEVSFESRVLIAYEVAQVFQSDESIALFERLLNRLLNAYEHHRVGNKGMLLLLLARFSKNDFKDVPLKEECLETSKLNFMQELKLVDDFERFFDFREAFPTIVSQDDLKVMHDKFIEFYPDEVDDYTCEVEDIESVSYFAESLEKVASAFDVNVNKEMDLLASRCAELDEEQSRYEIDEEPDDDYRFESRGAETSETETDIESLFSTLLEES